MEFRNSQETLRNKDITAWKCNNDNNDKAITNEGRVIWILKETMEPPHFRSVIQGWVSPLSRHLFIEGSVSP